MANVGKPPVLLAHKWSPVHDPTGWWMSEKLDGVRAYWDGRRFLSRAGNEYFAPAWFTRALPAFPLDGELWIDRKQFQKCVGVVRRHKADEGWREVRYLVFDAPNHGGAFEARVTHLTDVIQRVSVQHLVPVDHIRCDGADHLKRELARVEALGGEGLMLRQPGSSYAAGRSRTLLKVKTFHDAEARVVGYVDGQGRHHGRVGALSVITPGGVEFAIGSGLTDAERDDPPKVGDIVTYRYQELTDGGVPRFPTFLRIRQDFVWPGAGQPAVAVRATPTNAAPATPTQAAPSPAPATPPAQAATPSPASPQRPVPTKSGPTNKTRYFEHPGAGGKPAAFWEITAQGIAVAVRYGPLGTRGQTKIKTYRDKARAASEAERLIGLKRKKGFVEQP